MAKGDDRLWVEVMRKKYSQGTSFFAYVGGKGDSSVWKGILTSREVIRRGACYKIGNGWSIDVKCDPWLLGEELNRDRFKDG